jgi:divalent metal cation (Fe/Co/Zn/Cd) transporter
MDSVRLYKRAIVLAYATVTYNLLEGVVSIAFALWAGSTALLGFGIDSFVESASGLVMIWRFSDSAPDHVEARERKAARLVGAALILLSLYVGYESLVRLYQREAPVRQIAGLVIAAVSLVVMPPLFLLKRQTALQIGSRSLAADSKQTLACCFLSVALLAGTGLHYAFGWWYADPLAALVIAAFVAREGYQAIARDELCCG